MFTALLIGLVLNGAAFAADQPIEGSKTSEVELPARIDRIEWKGIWRTHESVFLRELPWRPGEVVSPEDFLLGIERIGDLPFISHAGATVQHVGSENVAIFLLDEKFSIMPIFSASESGNDLLLNLGVSERNFFGTGITIAAEYQYIEGVSGGLLYYQDPRFLGNRTPFTVTVGSGLRPRPDDVVQHTLLEPELDWLFNRDETTIGLALEGFYDTFSQPTAGFNPSLPPAMPGAFLQPLLRVGRTYRVGLRHTGQSLELTPQVGVVYTPTFNLYAQLNAQAKKLWMLGDRWNFLLRVMGGVTTAVPDQMQYFLGGVDYLLGYPDNFVQANEFVLFDFDICFTLFEFKLLALQPYFFTDGVGYGGGTLAGTVVPGGEAISSGFGLLFSIPLLVDSNLRLYVAAPFQGFTGFTFGASTVVFY